MTSTESTRTVPFEKFENFGIEVLKNAGMSAEDATICSHHLASASLRGVDSHGFGRYLMYSRRVKGGGIVSPTKVEVISDSGSTFLLDGCNGVGQVIGQRAMEMVVERAKSTGISFATVRGGNHLGALAPYTIYAAENDCIGIAMTNASPRVAPSGGSQAMLGNNPWSISVPGPERPIVMDMANSVAALGKVRILQARGELLPEGWARDNEGMPTRDPQAAITGLLEPIAGYKGYVIAMMIELLTGAFSGGGGSYEVSAVTNVSKRGNTSHSFFAISIENLMTKKEFLANVGKLTSDVRNSRLARDSEEILIPGDLEARKEVDRRAHGVPLTPELADLLRTASSEFSVPTPEWLA